MITLNPTAAEQYWTINAAEARLRAHQVRRRVRECASLRDRLAVRLAVLAARVEVAAFRRLADGAR